MILSTISTFHFFIHTRMSSMMRLVISRRRWHCRWCEWLCWGRGAVHHALPRRAVGASILTANHAALSFVNHYQRVRDEWRQLAKSELDLVVMGQLLALTQKDEMTQALRHSPKQRQRSFTCFKHGDHDVCMATATFSFFVPSGRLNSSQSQFWVQWSLSSQAPLCEPLPCITVCWYPVRSVVYPELHQR